MMISPSPSTLFSDYVATDCLLPKADPLSPIEIPDEQFEQSFDDEMNNSNLNSTRSSNIKRPMNAFLLWARGERKRMSSDGFGVSQTSLSKLLGETWRHMSMEEKQPFLAMAEKLKRQHHLDHPDYRFKPKQRSMTVNKSIVKKVQAPQLQQMLPSAMSTASPSSFSAATPLPIQSSVLAMCHAVISSTSNDTFDWFSKLTEQPQPVMLVPTVHCQTSPSTSSSSRRAVRIQIINKRDEIPHPFIPVTSALPMTPSPQSQTSNLPSTMIDESTPTLVEYLNANDFIYNVSDPQQGLNSMMDTSMGYETFHETSANQFADLDQNDDTTGWIDTPLSNFGTNSTDMMSSPYASYDFLCL